MNDIRLLPPANAALPRGFAHVDTWIFDLDNTLYPAGSALWPQIDERITLYLAGMFGLDGLSSRALQKYYYQRYGTTLRGLMDEHGMDPAPFLDFAHDIDRSSLAPHPELGAAIAALPGRKLIMTNGSVRHAQETVAQLGIGEHFAGIFDIVAAEFVPKPDEPAYRRFFAQHDVRPESAAMFEDLVKNLAVPHEHGMTTVLVVPPEASANREDWENEQMRDAHVDWITSDLAGFLASIPAAGGAAA